MTVLDCGAVRNAPGTSLPGRLRKIFEGLTSVIAKYRPAECAIETAFYGKNAQSALKLGHARGAALLAAVLRSIPTAEYSPREVKKAVVGNGNATKQQVQAMVMSLLSLKTPPKYFDTTDALAVAVCHAHRFQGPRRGFKDWKSYLAAHPEKIRTGLNGTTR